MLHIRYGLSWLSVEFLAFWENSIFKRSKGDKKAWLTVSLSDFKFWSTIQGFLSLFISQQFQYGKVFKVITSYYIVFIDILQWVHAHV